LRSVIIGGSFSSRGAPPPRRSTFSFDRPVSRVRRKKASDALMRGDRAAPQIATRVFSATVARGPESAPLRRGRLDSRKNHNPWSRVRATSRRKTRGSRGVFLERSGAQRA